MLGALIVNYSGNAKNAVSPDEYMYLHEEFRKQRDDIKRGKETQRTLSMIDALAKKR